MASTIFFADCNDTSCSADLPPNTIPTRNFAILKTHSLNAKHIHYHDKTQVSSASGRLFCWATGEEISANAQILHEA
jgi:hypothetical protein